jgi:hypothetical protein
MLVRRAVVLPIGVTDSASEKGICVNPPNEQREFWQYVPSIARLLAVVGLIAIPIMLISQLHITRSESHEDLVCTSVLGITKPTPEKSDSSARPESTDLDILACNQARIEQLAWTTLVLVPTVTFLAVALAARVARARAEDPNDAV